MRKEFLKLINPFIPKKVLHLTVRDAVLHAHELSRKRKYRTAPKIRI